MLWLQVCIRHLHTVSWVVHVVTGLCGAMDNVRDRMALLHSIVDTFKDILMELHEYGDAGTLINIDVCIYLGRDGFGFTVIYIWKLHCSPAALPWPHQVTTPLVAYLLKTAVPQSVVGWQTDPARHGYLIKTLQHMPSDHRVTYSFQMYTYVCVWRGEGVFSCVIFDLWPPWQRLYY